MKLYMGKRRNHPTAKLRQLYRRVKFWNLAYGAGAVLSAASIGVLLGQVVRGVR